MDPGDETDAEVWQLLSQALAPRLVLVRRLGAGGMGTVYLARDPALKRLVAIKVLSPELAREPDARARFEREAESVAAIAHPNVVAVYSVGEMANGVPYFVMQYVSGHSASERLASDGPFDIETTKRILGEVASALSSAHRQGIIHRDIKPANILLDDASGRAVVSDFGIAAVLTRDSAAVEAANRLTQTGTSLGTPAYMSPEQVLADPITEKTDIYSMGLLGYELLTARGAYNIKSPAEITAAHLRDAPIKLSTVIDTIDPEFEALLESCLAKEPDARPAAGDVAQRLIRGAGVLLDWPPPGLERIQGKLAKATRLLLGGAAALGIPFVVLMAFERRDFWREALPSSVFLGSILALGAVLYLAGGFRLLRSARNATRAVRAGHGWMTVLEVLLDRRGDAGALITGAREFAGLDPTARSRLRRERVIAGLSLLIAALVPVAGVFLLLPIFTRLPDAFGSRALVWIALVTTIALLLAAGILRSRETRRLSATRRRLRRETPPPNVLARLATAWRETFEQVRRGQTLGAGIGHRRAVGAAAIGVAVLIGVSALFGYATTSLSSAAEAMSLEAGGLITGMTARFEISEQMRPYRLAVDSTITPLRAGEAVHAISAFNRKQGRNERAPARPIISDWKPTADTGGFRGTVMEPWYQTAILRAPRGFTANERRALEARARGPYGQEFSVLSRARMADFGAAAWVVIVPDTVTWPMPDAEQLRSAARAELAQVALDLADGKVAQAEARARGVIGAGFALYDGRTLIEALLGNGLITLGREALIALFEATGRHAEARAINNAVAYGMRKVNPFRTTERSVGIEERNDTLRNVMRDPKTLRAMRWELALFRLPLQPCADLHQLVFGVDSAHLNAYAETRRTLVHDGVDSLLFDHGEHLMESPIANRATGVKDRAIVGAARLADLMVGGRRFESCAALLWY